MTTTPKTVAPTVEQVMAQADVLCQFYECHGVEDTLRYTAEYRELQSLVEALVVDAERLDWLIAKQAWIQWTVRDGSIRQCQVYDQDEDENYLILSGADRYFNTPREAIDVAMSSTEPPHADKT